MMKYSSWGLQVAVSNAGEPEHVGWLPCPSLHINKSHFEYCCRALVPRLLRCWNGSIGKNGNCSVLPSLISQHQISISIFQHLNEIICLGNEGVVGWLRPDDPSPPPSFISPSLSPSLGQMGTAGLLPILAWQSCGFGQICFSSSVLERCLALWAAHTIPALKEPHIHYAPNQTHGNISENRRFWNFYFINQEFWRYPIMPPLDPRRLD